MSTLKEILDSANPNTLPDGMRKVKVGTALAGGFMKIRNANPDAAGADPYNLSTVDIIKLPDNAKAALALRATARAGAVTGEFQPTGAFGATPGTTELEVSPTGDIAFLATDAVTDCDIYYLAETGKVVEVTADVAAGVLALPQALTDSGVVLLLEAEALVGTVTGKKVVLVPAAGLPATLQARLDIAKANVQFNNVTDAVTRARVKLLVVADEGEVQAALEAESPLLG